METMKPSDRTAAMAPTYLPHTPGPWRALRVRQTYPGAEELRAGWQIESTFRGTMPVAEIQGPYIPSMDRYEADARLIAAAPTLLAAAKLARDLLAMLHGSDGIGGDAITSAVPATITALDEAITKAREG